MSEQTEWKKWCEETAPVMEAAGRGEFVQVQGRDGAWLDRVREDGFCYGLKYRIKQRTIRIGEHDVPEPMREAPEVGSVFYVVNTADKQPLEMTWYGEEYDFYILSAGMIHANKRDAAHHMLALRSISSVSHTVDSYLTAKKD